MFDFLFKSKNNEIQSYMDMVSVEIKKLKLSKLAIQKAVGMIAHAVAKLWCRGQMEEQRITSIGC